MIWTLSLAAKSTLVLGAAAVVAWRLGRSSAATRHAVWCLALASLLVLPVLSASLPRLGLPLLPAIASEAARPLKAGADLAESLTLLGAGAARPSLSGGWRFLILVWLAGAGLALTRLAWASRFVSRAARRARPLTSPEWESLLQEASARLRVRRRVELRSSPAVRVPNVSGYRAPIVLLPAEAEAWPEERRRAILLHEIAHVARHDRLVQTVAYLARALYWPHPLVWWAGSCLHREAEHACDDRVLQAGTSASEYARHLVDVARALTRPAGTFLTASGGASSTHLGDRVVAVLDESRNRRVPTGRTMALAGGASLLAIAVLAAAEPVAARATDESRTARASAEPASRQRIVHVPVGCLVEGRFADVEAGIEPVSEVEEARLYFAGMASEDGVEYWIEMARTDGRFVGRLPKPRTAASPIRYRIEARMADGQVTATQPYLAVVAPSESRCPVGARIAPISSSTEPVVVHRSSTR
jgi:beta-lactamase regulating signal transducer with metallopeptidase domain